jgi:hypothetical protein
MKWGQGVQLTQNWIQWQIFVNIETDFAFHLNGFLDQLIICEPFRSTPHHEVNQFACFLGSESQHSKSIGYWDCYFLITSYNERKLRNCFVSTAYNVLHLDSRVSADTAWQ